MIELDGIEYPLKTPAENTQDLVTFVNQYCYDNNVLNSEGEVVTIAVNMASPIYLLFWATGYLASIVQRLLYSIGKQYSIAASSEKQLLNIATNAGVLRRIPTYTTIRALVYATAGGDCDITTLLGATIVSGGKSYRFSPSFAKLIPASGTAIIVLQSDTLGALSVPSGAIVQFDTDVPNFDHMTTAPSVPGRDLETLASLRRRLLARQSASSSLDLAIQAIRGLQGVVACNIFYNTNPAAPITVGGLSIAARHTALYIEGHSNEVARTYFTYTDRPSTDDTEAITQTITLLNGQTFPVYILPPVAVPVYVNIYTMGEVSDATKQLIRDAVIGISIDVDIGNQLTAAMVLEKMDPLYRVIGVTMSLVDTGPFSYSAAPEANELLSFSAANITIGAGV